MPGISNKLFGQQGFDAQQSFFTDFARRGYDISQRIAELNLRLAQQMLLDAATAARQMLASPDPFQAIAAGINASQPAFDHLRTYQLELASVFTGATGSSAPRSSPAAAGPAGGDPLTSATRAGSAATAAGYGRHH